MLLRHDLGFSLGLHAAILLACLIVVPKRAAQQQVSPPIVVEIDAALPQPRKSQDLKSKQVVRTRQAENERTPDESAFLGERNQVVDRQVVSRNGGLRPGSAPQQQERPQKVDLANLGVAVLPTARAKQATETVGDGAVREYITGVREGEETALSTREYMFYGYFERIRGRLDQAWEPILREHLLRHYQQGRRLASEMDHRTEVLVVLSGQGKILNVEVLSESGTQTLDSAAVQAFNRAGPFPNPPRGLVDRSGTVRIKWEFILKT